MPSVSTSMDACDFVLAQIAAAPILSDPFDHCFVENVFPEEMYRELVSSLPDSSLYQKYPPPYETRLYMNLDGGNSHLLPKAWSEVENFANSQRFLDGMARKFAHAVQGMAKYRAPNLSRHVENGAVSIGSRLMLTRDSRTYAIGPHTDSTAKFITALFYLAEDDKLSAFGTSIFRPKNSDFKAWKSPHYPFDDFEKVKTVPFKRNSALIFVKSDTSFHGVEPGNHPECDRNMMMWIPEIGRNSKTWGDLRLPVGSITG